MTRKQENLYVYPQAKGKVRWGLGEGQEGWSPVKLTLWLKLNLTFKEDLSNNFWLSISKDLIEVIELDTNASVRLSDLWLSLSLGAAAGGAGVDPSLRVAPGDRLPGPGLPPRPLQYCPMRKEYSGHVISIVQWGTSIR